MTIKSQFAVALVSALFLSPFALPAAAQSGAYLPPSERAGTPPPPDAYDAPQQISPRRGDSNPQAAPPPPYQGEQGDGGYRGGDQGSYRNDQGGYRDDQYDRQAGVPDDLPSRDRRDFGEPPPPYSDRTYSSEEIVDAGHRFFGGVSKELAKVVEYAFSKQGRPNGYILGEEAGGAVIAGLRYGEGRLYTKSFGVHRIYWQGPSLGYDFGAEGSKTLILVYNLGDVNQIYNRFAGVDGSAYLVGGAGVTFQTYDDVVLAPIRSGVGLRLGANVGYLKYTRTPTWNPF
jgi:hypothetical protein